MTRNQQADQVGLDPLPADLKELDIAGCASLAGRIRHFLIDSVSRTGGHLGANLGTVELTIALHRAYDPARHRIIFDTGHQAYTHKILTGRAGDFDTLRQINGLSGFPNRAESPADVVENSHASVGPAWALGSSLARGQRTIVVLGDGALTGGVAYEALNAIGFYQAPVTVVLNDNGRSYARTISRLTLGEPVEREWPASSAARQFFAALGFTYLGPVDGHDLAGLDNVLGRAAPVAGPVLVHVRTQKGYGLARALGDDTKRLHDVAATRAGPVGPSRPSWGTVFSELLCDLAAEDRRIHVITAAMPDTLGLLEFQRRFPARYHDVGICEQLAVAVAAGLATEGCRPVFAVVSTFLTRALDQVLYDVALHRLPVVFAVDRAGVTGPDGPSHHGIYDVGLLRQVPGMRIFSPATRQQLASTLRQAIGEGRGPTVIRYPKGQPLGDAQPASGREQTFRRLVGHEVCLLAHGATVAVALDAAGLLEERHRVSTSVWDVGKLHPVNTDIFDDATRHRVVVTVEDLAAGSGIMAGLLPYLASHRDRPVTVEEIALPAQFLPPGPRDEILSEYGITADSVVRCVMKALRAE